MKIMFLDESGDHNLASIKRDYPVFVLGGVIVDRQYVRTVVEPRLREFKLTIFGRDDIVFHTADIVRKKKEFACLEDSNMNNRFLSGLTKLMKELEYKVVACVIKKPDHVAKYGKSAADPYHFALDVLVERLVLELGPGSNNGLICAEKRRPDLDHALETAWQSLRVRGTKFASPEQIDERIVDLSLKDKKLNIAGMQLADLVVSPIGRAVLGKKTHADWEVVESKLRRVNGTYEGCGLKILPK